MTEENEKENIAYLAPDIILRFIINEKDEVIDKILKNKNMKIVTSTFCFWEVMSCLTESEIKKYNTRIYTIFKTIPITDLAELKKKSTNNLELYEVEDDDRIEHLRKIALDKIK